MDILFPRIIQQENFDEKRLRLMCEQVLVVWRKDFEARHAFEPENIRFEHDPNWQYKILSIQSARDGNRGIWKATKLVCTFMFGVV